MSVKKSRIEDPKPVADFIARILVERSDSKDSEELSKIYVESFDKAFDTIKTLTN